MTALANPSNALRWAILGLFVIFVAMLGGSSRYDAVQIAALRPLAALFLIPAFYWLSLDSFRKAKPLVALLLLWTLWTGLQLIPLPSALWHALPGREVISDLDALLGQEDTWRPISMVPARGMNALVSLIVPVVGLFLAIAVCANRRMLMLIICAVVAANGALSLLQVALDASSPLYFYATTNLGAPVGLLANENHSAMLCAVGIVLTGYLAGTSRMSDDPPWLKPAYAVTMLLALFSIFAGGSRFGFVIAVFALLTAIYLAMPSLRISTSKKPSGSVAIWFVQRPHLLLLLSLAALSGLSVAFFAADRMPGLRDLMSQNAVEEIRWQIWSILETMIRVHWLFGSGFGSFEELYYIYEPTNLMRGSYLNQAHNDWAQLVIEGGLPAILLCVALGGHCVARLRACLKDNENAPKELVFWLATIIIICAASLVDYPLRTPVFQVVVAFLLLSLFSEVPQQAFSQTTSDRRWHSRSPGKRS